MGIAWKDMSVSNLETGQPVMEVTGWAAERLREMTPPGHRAVIHVSLTDDHPWAQAFVVIEALPDPAANALDTSVPPITDGPTEARRDPADRAPGHASWPEQSQHIGHLGYDCQDSVGLTQYASALNTETCSARCFDSPSLDQHSRESMKETITDSITETVKTMVYASLIRCSYGYSYWIPHSRTPC